MRLQAAVFITCASLFVTQTSLDAQGKGGPKGGAKGWLSTLQEGKLQAEASGKPMMIVIRCVP